MKNIQWFILVAFVFTSLISCLNSRNKTTYSNQKKAYSFVKISAICKRNEFYPNDSITLVVKFTNKVDSVINVYPEGVIFLRGLPRHPHAPYSFINKTHNWSYIRSIPPFGSIMIVKKVKLDHEFFNGKTGLFELIHVTGCSSKSENNKVNYCGGIASDSLRLKMN